MEIYIRKKFYKSSIGNLEDVLLAFQFLRNQQHVIWCTFFKVPSERRIGGKMRCALSEETLDDSGARL
jgi:hypothetical protein